MQESIPAELLSEQENKCPDCLFMELEGSLIQQEKQLIPKLFQQKKTTQSQISLRLLVNFNAQWEPLTGGRVKFGLMGGELKLKLENCKLPYEDRRFTSPFSKTVPKERQTQKNNKSKTEVKPSLGDKAKVELSLTTEATEGQSDKFQVTEHPISTKGSESSPVWVFEEKTGRSFLQDQFGKEELGILTIIGKPCCIEATFEVSQKDVQIIELEGVYQKNILPEKRTTIDILLVKLLLNHKLNPYVSKVEMRYE